MRYLEEGWESSFWAWQDMVQGWVLPASAVDAVLLLLALPCVYLIELDHGISPGASFLNLFITKACCLFPGPADSEMVFAYCQ